MKSENIQARAQEILCETLRKKLKSSAAKGGAPLLQNFKCNAILLDTKGLGDETFKFSSTV